MKLWGGRFTKETNQLVNNFNALFPSTGDSISRTLREASHM